MLPLSLAWRHLNDQKLSVWVLYLLSELPGPVDVVAPGDDDGKLEKDQQNSI